MPEEEPCWTLYSWWNCMGLVQKTFAVVLALMLAHALLVLVTRLIKYQLARRRARPLLRLLRMDQLCIGELLDVARASIHSHVGSVVLTGIEAFRSAPAQLSDRDAVRVTDGAMHRCESKVQAEMRLGLRTVATIAATAPFVGLLGTAFGIVSSFSGGGTSKATMIAAIAGGIAAALVFTAAGLAVSVFALWSYNCLIRRIELLDAQITEAILHLVAWLHGQSRERGPSAVSTQETVAEGLLTAGHCAEIPYDRGRLLLPYVSFLSLLILFFLWQLAIGLWWHFMH